MDARFPRGRRAVVVALLVGAVHAAAVSWFVARLALPVDVPGNAPGGVVGATVGLVALAAVPTALALDEGLRLLSPVVLSAVAAVVPVGLTVTAPLPSYSTLGGHLVSSGPLYIGVYVDAWYVWLYVALVVGLVEAVIRLDRDWAPPRARRLRALLSPTRPAARRTAGVVGVGHAVVLLTLAADWNYFAPDAYLPAPWYVGAAVLAWTLLGLVVVGSLGPYLLVRFRLLSPTLAFAWVVARVGWSQNMPLPDDPLPVYFLGWFFFAGLGLLVGAAEYGLRRLGRWVRRRSRYVETQDP